MTTVASTPEKQSEKPVRVRGKNGGARPGAGRKPGKLSAAKRELKELAREHVPAMLKALVQIAKESDSDAARVSAIKEVIDRAYGKAPQALTGEDGGPVKQVLEVVWAASSERAS